MRCPICASTVLRASTGDVAFDVAIPVHEQHLRCGNCDTPFPVSADCIPIMWDKEIQEILTQQRHTLVPDALSANLEIYEAISDDYRVHSRRDARLRGKMRSAVARALGSGSKSSPAYHLDFGCGPGHVLGWLADLGLTQIGLDISLNNLRNARDQWRCLVVCGSACNIPFRDGVIQLVTESSVLHHIQDWQRAVSEALRVCARPGGVVLDAEPTKAQMDLSRLAVAVFNSRFRAYQMLSYFMPDKYVFRDIDQARLNVRAEIHHQPGTGFPLPDLKALFERANFDVEVVLSPSATATEYPDPNWKEVALSILSARNPWNPEYGNFTAIGRARSPQPS